MSWLCLSSCPVNEIRGLEQCPLELLDIDSCPVKSIDDICPLPNLKEMRIAGTPMAQPTKEALRARWKNLDYLQFAPGNENGSSEYVMISLFSETERFQAAVAEADRVVIRDGGFGCCTKPESDPVLLELREPKEIAELRGIFKFKDLGSNEGCMCCGHPGIDWWKGGEKLAQTALHHGKTVWWDGFTWDFVLTEKSQKEIAAWLSSHSIPQDNAKR